MKLIKTLTWGTALTAGVFLGTLTHGATAHASPAVQSSLQQPDRDRAREREPIAVTGELTRVMPDRMAFWVKGASGAEMMFYYNDRTIVIGEQNNTAGLAMSSRSIVTVTYRNESEGRMALKIEIQPRKP